MRELYANYGAASISDQTFTPASSSHLSRLSLLPLPDNDCSITEEHELRTIAAINCNGSSQMVLLSYSIRRQHRCLVGVTACGRSG
jgi:hypothetical protein